MPAIHRRPVVKAPASKAAKAGKSSAAAKTAKAAAARKPAAKAPAKVVAKKAPAKAVKAPVKAPAKPAVKAAAKPAPKAAKPAVKPVAKAVKPAPKAAAPKPVAKAAAQPAANAKGAAARAASVASALINKVAASPAPAPVAPVATPRPVSKRDARKAMMEQMTQAEVVPTHAPDAAKATFSNTIERTVMTPPVPTSLQKDPKRANNWKTLSLEQLTDQDVLAMPDSEYMNDQQLAFFRLKLQRLKADMLANAGETTEHLREDTVVVPDPADRATIEEEHALELRTRDRERKLLKKIEQAIARIDSGDYGYCEETGEPIGVGRLMARPTASLSLEAQQRRELKQKMFGD
jgi:DnaK suppressor protein